MRLIKRLLLAVALIGVVVVIWAVVAVSADTPVTYDDIAEHFSYGSIGAEPGGSLLQPIGGVLPPLRGVDRDAVDLPREAAARRLCRARLHHGARSRSADRRFAPSSHRHRSYRAELRDLPYRHGARFTDRGAAHRASACRRTISICRTSYSSSSTARSTTA